MSHSSSDARWSLEPYCIGMKLRALRTRKGLTLSRLAAETGLSTALLSKLETDHMIPTLPTLAAICRVYGVGLSHFFCEPVRHSLSITRKAQLLARSRSPEDARLTPLQGSMEPAGLEAQLLELAAGGAAHLPGGKRFTSCVVYVLQGQLQVDTGGVQETMETGDCAALETEMATSLSAAGSQPCRVLMVTPGA